MTLKLLTIILIYRIITFGSISFSTSTLIMPFWFFLGDIIAERYGFKIARQLIWMAIFCQFLFAIVCTILLNISADSTLVDQNAYNKVLGSLPRVSFASFLAIFFGGFINAYFITKWKIICKGRFFWLRSLCASIIGEFIFTFMAYAWEFFGVVPIAKVFELMSISFLVKVILNPILVIPACFIAFLLKKGEGVEVYDFNTNFNPFKLSIDEQLSNISTANS